MDAPSLCAAKREVKALSVGNRQNSVPSPHDTLHLGVDRGRDVNCVAHRAHHADGSGCAVGASSAGRASSTCGTSRASCTGRAGGTSRGGCASCAGRAGDLRASDAACGTSHAGRASRRLRTSRAASTCDADIAGLTSRTSRTASRAGRTRPSRAGRAGGGGRASRAYGTSRTRGSTFVHRVGGIRQIAVELAVVIGLERRRDGRESHDVTPLKLPVCRRYSTPDPRRADQTQAERIRGGSRR